MPRFPEPARQPLADEQRLDLASGLTLILLLLHAPDFWYARTPLAVLSIVGLIHRPLRHDATLWFAVTAFLGATLWFNWFILDNHKFLEAYWCLALFLVFSLPAADRAAALAANGRWLIALTMAFSVFWKLASPTYRDGSFFEYTLLTDARFEHLAVWFGGLTPESLIHNRSLEQLLGSGGTAVSEVRLTSSPEVERLAALMTWWTVGIEAVLAVAFLAPLSERALWLRDVLLLVFAATTYLVAPVQGFGWLLMILGLAQCRRRWAAVLYIAAFLLIEIYTMPYADVVNSILNRPA